MAALHRDDNHVWLEVGRSALAGAVAGAALAVLGLRVGLNGALEPAPSLTARMAPSTYDPPLDAPLPPAGRREESRAIATQAAAGAALGAIFGYLRTRSDRPDSPAEAGIYGLLLSAVGLGNWLAPLGLADRQEEPAEDRQPDDWSFRGESLLDDLQPPYETQPPYDPESPYDVF
jgi:hypothetical protein